ncbi:hypothetical protein F2Q69_00001143 [Brassica cretica]|uniref:Protein kinase domain-containing protein n=1 Tax=Brassica cretica TaxID=69181 RepID=A0A8S9P991_BRACR|nr:hypothetical protein F2Q69_00001143 [Brassica cretica]
METRTLSDSMIRDFTLLILQGLVSVHGHGYLHCDLKPENLLVFPRRVGGLQSTYELKISDFGMSTKAGEESEFWEFDSPFLGTPLYMSPESVQEGVAEKALDLWSLGVFYCGLAGAVKEHQDLAKEFSHKTSTKFCFHKENF